MASFFATQAAIPYLIVEVLGGTATEYGIWFGVGCAFYVIGNYVTGRWGSRFQSRNVILFSGVSCLTVAVAGSIAAHFFAWKTALLFLPTIALYFLGAIAVASAQAEGVAAQPAHSGAASGLIDRVANGGRCPVVHIIGVAHDGTPYSIMTAIVACSAAAFASVVNVYRMAGVSLVCVANR